MDVARGVYGIEQQWYFDGRLVGTFWKEMEAFILCVALNGTYVRTYVGEIEFMPEFHLVDGIKVFVPFLLIGQPSIFLTLCLGEFLPRSGIILKQQMFVALLLSVAFRSLSTNIYIVTFVNTDKLSTMPYFLHTTVCDNNS